MHRLIPAILAICSTTAALAGDGWPQFRGPTGDGHSEAVGLPITWSETENIVWKTPIHGRGWSSPVVLDGQVWMTTATEDGLCMYAVCVDLESGRLVHDLCVFTNREIVQEFHSLNSYASPTPVLEAGRVYVHFGIYGTACLDTASGKVLWQRRDIHCDHFRGPGSSPILFGDLLIFPMDGIDVQYVIALDKTSGRTVWKTDRSIDLTTVIPDFRKAYSTPLVIEYNGRKQLISTGAQASYAYDPATGKEIWRVTMRGFSNASRPLFDGRRVFVNSGFSRPELWAVRPDGHGDVTASHVDWTAKKGLPVKPSPVLVDGLIYAASDRGVATCLEAASGELVWQERIGGQYSASPVYADGRIYFFSHDDEGTVIAPGRTLNVLAANRLDAGCMASPAVVGKAIIVRTKKHLYRIENTASRRKQS